MRPILIAMVALSCHAAEVEYPPVLWNPPAAFPPILREVASLLPPNTDAKDADLITYTHEGAHFLSSGRRPGHHGIYVGEGRRVFIPTPPVRTAAVFSAVPAAKRGTIYETYRRQGMSEYWRDQPLMILDEWNAYRLGSIARLELRVDRRRETTVHCATMAGYAAVMYRMAKKKDGYPIGELKDFCDWHLARCREVIPDWDELTDASFD